ncbi:MAG: NAD-dependent epimerase/dehydratase family protein [Deltaproteobacteria bacterium]|jgi:UDP-glucose 4-epimerase|nr:NAD-dependent epimerase/dehydratase family protein [Deltaproteobacteria bacterium]
MRVLVTGGAGFIGSHTVDALVERGVGEIAVIDDLSTGKRAQVNAAARFYQADVRDDAEVRRIVGEFQPQVLFHLAAQMDVRRSVAAPVFDAQVNLLGLLELLEAGRQNGLRRVVFASSGGAIYGEQETFPCSEDHPLRPMSPYGVAKLASEKYLAFYATEYGIKYLALRYANVYGPRQDPHGEAGVVAIFCRRLAEARPLTIFGDGAQSRDYVFVGDVVRANLAGLEEQAAEGAFNIGTGVETSVNELAARLAALAGVRLRVEYAAARPGEQRRSSVASRRAAELLGWRPQVDLGAGLRATFAQIAGRTNGSP